MYSKQDCNSGLDCKGQVEVAAKEKAERASEREREINVLGSVESASRLYTVKVILKNTELAESLNNNI